MFKKIGILTVLLAGIAAYPPSGFADVHHDLAQPRLGLNPGHVFSLWTNINACLISIAHVISDDADWHDRLAAMTPKTFQGKEPADVLKRLKAYRNKFDRLRGKENLSHTKWFNVDSKVISPSVSYVNSGHVLNSHVEWLIRHTSSEQLISPFYTRHDAQGKNPDDVFALLDLADQRLDLILAQDIQEPEIGR